MAGAPEPAAAETPVSATDIRSIVGVLLRHWVLIAVVVATAVAGAIVALSLIAPQYRSSVQILIIDPRQPANAAEDRKLSSLDVDAAAVASVVEVMRSKLLALTVARDQGLDKDPEFTERRGPGAFLKAHLGALFGRAAPLPPPPVAGDNISPQLDRAAEALRDRLEVDRLTFSYVLSVSLTSESPAKAQRLVTAVANAYLNDQLEARYEATRRATTWLTGRLETLKTRVEQDEAAIQKLKVDNGLTDIGSGSNMTQQQLSDVTAQLALARADVAEKRARYDQITRAVNSGGNLQSIPEVMASPVIGQLRVQEAEVRRREVDLRNRYGERYPDVLNAKSQLDDIHRAIAAEAKRILDTSKNAYEIAQEREQSLEKSLAAMAGQAGHSQALVQLQQLERVADSNRRLYENFLNQFNEIDQKSTLIDVGARIISPAALPTEPSYPRWTLTIFLATATALVAGVVLAFLMEYLESGLKTAAQVERALGYPLLALVPRVRSPRFAPRMERIDILKRLVSEPFSQLSEAIRTIRIGMALSDPGQVPKVTVVTSAIPGEGKSTMSMLIAAAGALSHQRVVLVDCDLRRKSLTTAFDLRNRPGLIEILTDQVPLAEATYRDETTMLSIIPGGADLRDYPDLLNSQQMRDLTLRLREQYDCVVLDATPLLPIIDAAVLVQHADKILMVIEWNKTPRASALEALKTLRCQPRQIAGVILNKVDFTVLQSYGYGFGSGYNYGYHYRALEKYYRKR